MPLSRLVCAHYTSAASASVHSLQDVLLSFVMMLYRFTGVYCFDGKYAAAMFCYGKKNHLGLFSNEAPAARAYDMSLIYQASCMLGHIRLPTYKAH